MSENDSDSNRSKLAPADPVASPRVAVITGASSGIGLETAKNLTALGWRIIGQGRDPGRCAEALAQIQAASPSGDAVMLQAELSSLSETARLADEIGNLTERVDVLINNAGGLRDRLIITPEGNEATFAGNYLGPFMLTGRLLPLLRASSASSAAHTVRVINVSSLGHEYSPAIDWRDIQRVANWNSSGNYCLAKLCNLLFTRSLAKLLLPQGIAVHAMHPGVVDSNFHAHATPEMQRLMHERPGDAPQRSAATLAWLATADEPGETTGGYFYDMAAAETSSAAQDDNDAARLWDSSLELLKRSGFAWDNAS